MSEKAARYFEHDIPSEIDEVTFMESLKQRQGAIHEQLRPLINSVQNNFICKRMVTIKKDYNVYTGIGGVMLMLHKISMIYDELSTTNNEQIDFLSSYTSSHEDETDTFRNFLKSSTSQYLIDMDRRFVASYKRNSKPVISFLCGASSAYSFQSIYAATLQKKQIYLNKLIQLYSEEFTFSPAEAKQIDSKNVKCNELLYGRVGYLYALLFTSHHSKQSHTALKKITSTVVSDIFKAGRSLSKHDKSESPLLFHWKEKRYLGAAHGMSGILFVLMEKYLIVNYTLEEKDELEKSIQFVIKTELKNGNYPSRPDSNRDVLVQFCHGATGIALMLCRAFEVFGKNEYLKAAENAAKHVFQFGLLRKGVGLCHGISGNGYVFIYLFRITKNINYLHQALSFAEYELQNLEELHKVPDDPYSLYNGLAGAICFLYDVLKPEKASFPAFDVGSN